LNKKFCWALKKIGQKEHLGFKQFAQAIHINGNLKSIHSKGGIIMKKTISVLASAFLLVGLLSGTAVAQDEATIFIIHGIPGIDLNLDPKLPVDITLDGACLLQNFKFGSIRGPFSLPAGTYNIQIKLADPDNPCGGTTVIEADVPFEANEKCTVIAHLAEDGGITASKFTHDLSGIKRNKARILMHHTAYAPGVDVIWMPLGDFRLRMVQIDEFEHGDKFQVEVRPFPQDAWRLSLAPAGTGTPIFFQNRQFQAYHAYGVFAVGSVANGTFRLIVNIIPGVK
jgi:hypothetical protein